MKGLEWRNKLTCCWCKVAFEAHTAHEIERAQVDRKRSKLKVREMKTKTEWPAMSPVHQEGILCYSENKTSPKGSWFLISVLTANPFIMHVINTVHAWKCTLGLERVPRRLSAGTLFIHCYPGYMCTTIPVLSGEELQIPPCAFRLSKFYVYVCDVHAYMCQGIRVCVWVCMPCGSWRSGIILSDCSTSTKP